MSKTPITVRTTPEDREVLLLALRAPGWATSLELIADGIDAVKALRGAEGEVDIAVEPFVRDAVKAALTAALARGFFGPSEKLVELFTAWGIELPARKRA